MMALVLEGARKLALRDIEIDERMGPEDVTIAVHTVGICGSDVHYYEYGGIGTNIVQSPMVLGHEASGTVIDVGEKVESLKKGDRVCMEPGVPRRNSREYRLGRYNIDPAVVFWATPPVHGCLRPTVVHPADFTYKLPDNVSYAEGALVEPFAVGMHAIDVARLSVGSVVAVIGAGTIGIVTALAAMAGGASRVVISDISEARLDLAARSCPGVTTARAATQDIREAAGANIDVVFEASGAPGTLQQAIEIVCPGGQIVQIGCPIKEASFFVSDAQAKEVSMRFIFRYAHVYPRVLALFGSGKVNVKPLISRQYRFQESIQAFEDVSRDQAHVLKAQIVVAANGSKS